MCDAQRYSCAATLPTGEIAAGAEREQHELEGFLYGTSKLASMSAAPHPTTTPRNAHQCLGVPFLTVPASFQGPNFRKLLVDVEWAGSPKVPKQVACALSNPPR